MLSAYFGVQMSNYRPDHWVAKLLDGRLFAEASEGTKKIVNEAIESVKKQKAKNAAEMAEKQKELDQLNKKKGKK